MKKVTRILCMALASIMVLATVFTVAACPNNRTVKFMVDGKQFLSVKVDRNSAVKEPENQPEKEGHKFSHWYQDKNKISLFHHFDKPVTKNLTLHAYFVPNEAEAFEVTFNYLGGTIVNMILEKGLTLYEPYMPDERFLGWYTKDDDKFNDFNKPVESNIFLTAKYVEGGKGTLVMNSGDFDGVFSPFFSSSAYDGAVAGQTQIGMLSSDHRALVKVGEDVPTVAKDYKSTTFVRGVPDPTGELANRLTKSEKENGSVYWTEYEFLIKNGIKFSDGKDLTIKDVLFNMYINLDPVYDGSATMYSTAIKGLKAYRTQDPSMIDSGSLDTWREKHEKVAAFKKSDIYLYFYYESTGDGGKAIRDNFREDVKNKPEEKTIIDDVQYVRQEFWKEVISDYKTAAATPFGITDPNDPEWDPEKPFGDTNPYADAMFTQVWEVFLYMNGLITVERGPDGLILNDPKGEEGGGKYDPRDGEWKQINYLGREAFSKDPLDLIKIVYNNMLGIESTGTPSALDGTPIDWEIDDAVYKTEGRAKLTTDDKAKNDYSKLTPYLNDLKIIKSKYIVYETAKNGEGQDYITTASLENKEHVVNKLRGDSGGKILRNIKNILRYWATGQNVTSAWINDSVEAAAEALKKDDRFAVEKIDGIKVEKVTSFNNSTLNEEHYVLKIEIVGVDPKAIWNFGFNVAPMEYYSDCAGKGSFQLGTDGYLNFNYPGVDGYDETKPTKLGFKQHSREYFEKVFKDENVIRLPKGAGAYVATNSTNGDNPSYSKFFENNVVYFKANNNFQTTGERVSNPRISKLRYQVIDTSKVMQSLESQSINYGDPQAKQESVEQVRRAGHLSGDLIDNLGYGYVGINTKYVQNINIRKIIMTAMDTEMIRNYYGDLAQIITRPMSTNSWAYPVGEEDAYPFISEQNVDNKIESLLGALGNKIRKQNGKLQIDEEGWKDLKYTFTIAGAETDHPAYAMFLRASEILNKHGFATNVLPDPLALSKLAGGTLHVWAAAWGSGIDPDMYQTYHKDSTASSVRAWGYPHMKDNKDLFRTELGIIDTLSDYIDEGRSTLDQAKRASIYKNALNEVMKLAVEYPTYQRSNYIVYNKNDFDTTTFFRPLGPYSGHLNRIWEVVMLND